MRLSLLYFHSTQKNCIAKDMLSVGFGVCGMNLKDTLGLHLKKGAACYPVAH